MEKRKERLQRLRLVRAQQADHALHKVGYVSSILTDLADGSMQSPYKTLTSCWEAVDLSVGYFSNAIESCPLAEEISMMTMKTIGLAGAVGGGGGQSRRVTASQRSHLRLVKP